VCCVIGDVSIVKSCITCKLQRTVHRATRQGLYLRLVQDIAVDREQFEIKFPSVTGPLTSVRCYSSPFRLRYSTKTLLRVTRGKVLYFYYVDIALIDTRFWLKSLLFYLLGN
jgi:hypothetical protein